MLLGMSTTPDIIRRFFEHDADRDIDAIVALFSDDATVIDEAETRHGIDEIRAWQTGPASRYTYSTEILGISDGEAWNYFAARAAINYRAELQLADTKALSSGVVILTYTPATALA